MLVTRSVLRGLRKLFWFNRCFPLRVLDLVLWQSVGMSQSVDVKWSKLSLICGLGTWGPRGWHVTELL